MRAYQRVEPLTIGELWAIAITLRIVLVENLRRLAEQIVRSRAARQEADALADSLLGLGKDGPEVAAASLRDSRGGAPDGGPPSSSSSACAIRTRRSRPRSAGSRSGSPPRAPRPTRSSASSTSARPR